MATAEAQVNVNRNLQKQDLRNLEVSNLTPLSPEVISRQATINIGTIGHVAHGKSTVVKAISGVQTVRFKNELERNITIKLERLSEKKIQLLLKSKHQRHKYDIQQQKQLRLLAERRKERVKREAPHAPAPAPAPAPVPSRISRRSTSQTSLSPSHSSGYGSSLGCDDSEQLSQLAVGPLKVNDLKRRRSSGVQTPTPSAKRSKNNDGNTVKKRPKGEYIVERIECVEVVKFEPVFYVKWLGYDVSANTWESYDNLSDCAEMEKFVEHHLQLHQAYIAHITGELETQLANIPPREDMQSISIAEIDAYDPLELQIDIILLAQYRAAGSRSQREPERIGERALHRMQIRRSHFQRRKQLQDLLRFEQRMNRVELPSPPIRVENNWDLDTIDSGFKYIQKNIIGAGVPKPQAGLVGCRCHESGEGCTASSMCCGRMAGELFAYERSTGRLRLRPGSAIYECNSRCFCDESCTNRLVQNGRKHPLVLFKTNNGSGWGVRTPQALRKGVFVCEYIGEIITCEEANQRGKAYDDNGRTYLFDLDYNTSRESEYTVDAANYGNISHFINHSCDPNLAVFPCWIEHLNMALPHLVFFTIRPIKAGEELSFDYIRADNEEVPYENISTAARVQCRCGAANCRKVLF